MQTRRHKLHIYSWLIGIWVAYFFWAVSLATKSYRGHLGLILDDSRVRSAFRLCSHLQCPSGLVIFVEKYMYQSWSFVRKVFSYALYFIIVAHWRKSIFVEGLGSETDWTRVTTIHNFKTPMREWSSRFLVGSLSPRVYLTLIIFLAL